MIGDKLLEEPKTTTEAIVIFERFGLNIAGLVADTVRIFNAKRLVELNNEVYEKLSKQDWNCVTCQLKQEQDEIKLIESLKAPNS